MSEIEKMYKNAGCTNVWVQRYNDGYYEHERRYNSYKEMINNMMKANDWTLTEAQEVAKRECKKEHPPFTSEKQIELIKWLAKNLLCSRLDWLVTCCDNFEEGLGALINTLWQDLTAEEKQQIKRILE